MFIVRYETIYKDVRQGSLLLHTPGGRQNRILSFIVSNREAPAAGPHPYGFASNGGEPLLFYVSSRQNRLFFKSCSGEDCSTSIRYPQFIVMRADGSEVDRQRLYECVQRMFMESYPERKHRTLQVEFAPDAIINDFPYFPDSEEEEEEEDDDEEDWV